MERMSEAARLERTFDWIVIFVAACLFIAAFHLHVMLFVGDWDFWTDWKDRRWWVTVTPIALITFPAAVQTFLWEKLRLPFGATFCILLLVIGEWLTRSFHFYGWVSYPLNFTWPATMLPSALVLDIILMQTGSVILTAIVGSLVWAAMFYPGNWPMLAPFRVPVEYLGNVMSLSDLQGYQYIRTSTPEYLRIIERGTLRTFGEDVTPVSAAFSGFVCVWVYLWWWGMARAFYSTRFVRSV
ncbi:MAG: bacterial ammonia monooxygenase, subunit AmoA [Candidatus Binatia bacterium]